MKGINKVFLSGNVLENIEYGRVGNGSEACSFQVASDRHTANSIVTAYVKVNVYVEGLIRICRMKLAKGVYVLVEGELMNRDGKHGGLTEVRAREIIFLSRVEEAGGTT
jgi:single-stranded DNA-binding protein